MTLVVTTGTEMSVVSVIKLDLAEPPTVITQPTSRDVGSEGDWIVVGPGNVFGRENQDAWRLALYCSLVPNDGVDSDDSSASSVPAELVDPEKISASITVDVGPAVVGPVLFHAELDLVHPLEARRLVQPAGDAPVEFQVHVIDALVAVNVGKPDTKIVGPDAPALGTPFCHDARLCAEVERVRGAILVGVVDIDGSRLLVCDVHVAEAIAVPVAEVDGLAGSTRQVEDYALVGPAGVVAVGVCVSVAEDGDLAVVVDEDVVIVAGADMSHQRAPSPVYTC